MLSWWAAAEGAYFGTVFYPGAIVLAAGAIVLAMGAPWHARLRESPAVVVSLVALVALACWYGLSALWSPAPDIAVADAQRVFVYALACGLGLWVATLLDRRPTLALAPVAIAAAFAATYTVLAMLTGDEPQDYLALDGTLDFPLGYRNANAAFFLMAVWPALGLASDRTLNWGVRALSAGAATLSIDLAILSQSRGSMIATPIALVAFLALSPHRARALVWLLIAALPAILILPAAVDLYAAGEDGMLRDALDEVRGAGRAGLRTAAIAIGIGAVWARVEGGAMRLSARARISWNRIVAALGVALLIGGAVAFVAEVGDPIQWVDDRFDELGAGNPERAGQTTRFGFDAGSRRTDLWRVALDDGAGDPLQGLGGGGFQYSYTQNRDVVLQYARDAHSVELEVFSELGYPGLILLLLALGGLGFAALCSLARGPEARALAAAAIAGATYWLAHTSVDWFWAYPAITAGALYLVAPPARPPCSLRPQLCRGAPGG